MKTLCTPISATLLLTCFFLANSAFAQGDPLASSQAPVSSPVGYSDHAGNRYQSYFPRLGSEANIDAAISAQQSAGYYIPASYGNTTPAPESDPAPVYPNAVPPYADFSQGYAQGYPGGEMVGHGPQCDGVSCGCGGAGCTPETGGFSDNTCGLILPQFNTHPCTYAGSSVLGPGTFFIDGYIQQGLTWGSSGRDNHPQAMNDRGNGYQMNQLYLSLGRSIVRESRWAIGGQIDVMFGSDYYYAQSRGLETTRYGHPRWNGETSRMTGRGYAEEYGVALPQAFFEVYSPWLQGISFKVGHFYSPMGYESMMPTQNFFYSHSYTSIYGLPTSMTGLMTTTRLAQRTNLVLGAVNGWNGSETVNNDWSFVAGMTFDTYNQGFSLAAMVMTGKQDIGLYGMHRYAYSGYDMDSAWVTVFNLQAKWRLSCQLTYAVDFVAGIGERELTTSYAKEDANWFGLSNYLFYQINDRWAVGTRFEWFNDPQDSMIIASQTGEKANYYAWTIGAKWTPLSWLTVRPEFRWDYSDYKQTLGGKNYRAFDNGDESSQFTFGVDAIIRF